MKTLFVSALTLKKAISYFRLNAFLILICSISGIFIVHKRFFDRSVKIMILNLFFELNSLCFNNMYKTISKRMDIGNSQYYDGKKYYDRKEFSEPLPLTVRRFT